jgi:hypothetical protein
MTRLTDWISRSGNRRRAGKPSGPSRVGRALGFERYEERIALSTTTAGEPVSGVASEALNEGGFIGVDYLSVAGRPIVTSGTNQNAPSADFNLSLYNASDGAVHDAAWGAWRSRQGLLAVR